VYAAGATGAALVGWLILAIPSTIDVSDWSTIAPHYDALLAEHLPTYSYLRATINTTSPATAAIQSAIDAQTSSYSVRVTAMSVMLDGQAHTGTEIERLQRDPLILRSAVSRPDRAAAQAG
jgi:hypothetical protein